MTTSQDIVNQALNLCGDNAPQVTGFAPAFDTSTAGIAASKLYAPAVQTVARRFGWDFSRANVALTASGNTAPFPWSKEYLYPTMGIEVRQLLPPAATDANDPLPVNWAVGNALVSAVPTKVIWTNLASAIALYTNQPNENAWDALFREAVVRLLASEFGMALFGRPDTSRDLLESGDAFAQTGMTRRD